MAGIVTRTSTTEVTLRPAQREPWWLRLILIGSAIAVLFMLLLLPLVTVFAEAMRRGWEVYAKALTEPDALSALRLTVLVAAIAVPINIVIGVAAAWAVTKFDFKGKSLLITMIDLPFAVSP